MIELKQLRKSFSVGGRTLHALDGIDLSIGTGEVFGFIGPNGAGKSTTMRILAGLLRQNSGTATVNNLNTLTDGDAIRRIIGYMPDFLGVYDDLTVDEYLQFFAAAFKITRPNRRRIVDQVLELTDLTSKRAAMVDSLSRGMQQRLGIARVLIHDPKVLLLDEPASGLDPRARIEMRSLITELGRMGKTIMVSSHILTELGEMCSSLGMIERGQLLFAGSLQDAFARVRAAGAVRERILIELAHPQLDSTAEASLDSAPAVTARPDLLSHAITALTADHRVQSVDRDPQNPAGLIIECVPGEHGHHFVFERLDRAGLRLRSFTPQTLKLEDAFLKLTTGALQ
jgi:ABC-2 type transport system ATP-binding protein